jgi:hypothetical protein
MEWTLHITYGRTPFSLKAEVEYQSAQIMRIRVYGSKSSLLLENNFPLIKASRGKRAIQWKIREGKMSEGSEENSRLLLHIIEQLEHNIKKEFPSL